MGVHVGPGVLGFTLLQEHVWDNLVKLGNQLKHGVIGQMLQSKLALAGVTWVGLPQDSMAVAWNHLQPGQQTRLQTNTSFLPTHLYTLLKMLHL